MSAVAAAAADVVPLVDLAVQHDAIADEVRDGFRSVIARAAFIGGREIAEFESAFAEYCGAAHCAAVANGTDALELLLRANGIGAGDEVVLPANTFVATAEAVIRAGAIPVLADVDQTHLLLDPGSVRQVISARTRAVIAVHLFGQTAPMAALRDVADEAGAILLEDAAQAHGARQLGKAAGALARGAGFSFYPGKNLGAYGDAGAVVTDDARVDAMVRMLRDHGSETRYEHVMLGVNSRLDTLQAVVLQAKLRHLDAWNAQRREAAARYDELFAWMTEVTCPAVAPDNVPAWHLYVIRVPHRDTVLAALKADGVAAAIHYPRPVHRQPAFRDLERRCDLRVSEEAAQSILSLPIFPGITAAAQERVAAALVRALGQAA
jgi:dTDP-4-amino-4,6-dideoxygalactose transaminase